MEIIMWKCPKCGREFKKNNQSHFCGEPPKTVQEYIMRQDSEKQADLFLIRETLQQALPEAKERISWGMPTYWENHNILHFTFFTENQAGAWQCLGCVYVRGKQTG